MAREVEVRVEGREEREVRVARVARVVREAREQGVEGWEVRVESRLERRARHQQKCLGLRGSEGRP